ncbi:putative fermentation associated protein (Csf1) [Aspergillus saccharolyticus JOP 1030-1]|uniref:Fermentation associated protein n=1 Tax=Aspergillus saccharolyticus JOP 1030-1 TaxID=1450539 RepID=A0A319ASH8_9EURO|nr:fermentation associated protein [Aspergillus saccharolyticus JOP 1030-1]PYH49222.1 fermentation associated protein [Aspergillus saccharolyticus JOP 1030-1]
MASTSLTSLALTPDPSFNWFFLLELIVSCILVLFFLLYFNRLFATLLSYGIRAYTWHYYRAYVDIRALQISPLGGRIFFKGIRYHGVNETIFVHGGFITWQYWQRTVRQTDVTGLQCDGQTAEGAQKSGLAGNAGCKNDSGEQGGPKNADSLPCRITAKVYGLEWFIYNRAPAYEGILAGFNPSNSSPSATKPQYPESDTLDPNLKDGNLGSSVPGSARGDSQERPGTAESQNPPGSEQELGSGVARFLRLLPIRLECDKGAIVMGNEHTRSVLTTTFDSATGLIEACNAGPLDLYRQVFSFNFSHPVIQMRPNPDFKQNQLAAAKSLGSAQEDQVGAKRKRNTIFNYKLQKRRVWHSIRDLIPYFQKSVESFHVHKKHTDSGPRTSTELGSDTRWVGLSRYLDESAQDDHEEWSPVEYGRYSTILDSPGMAVAYYWDVPGYVKTCPPLENSSPPDATWRINSGPPPEWGIDVKINGGTINYGPWADRERVGLQNVFFPNAFRSAEPSEPLSPGVPRMTTVFTLRVEINDELTLRIPTREPSKDWQWKGRADAIKGVSKLRKQNSRRQSRGAEGEKGHVGPDRRPFGWLSLVVAGDSTIRYKMDMLASVSGFQSQLDLDLRGTKLMSSVNHALLWQCPKQLITCDLSVPLSWNSIRTWRFDIHSHDMELFLLRDHIFLLTDLVSDWASGPPPEYCTFVPFIYKIGLSFSNFQLFLNVNDMNIVNNPSDLDDNRTLAIKGESLSADVTIPLNKYRPEENAISFKVNLEDAGIDYLTPVWDTMHAFLANKSTAALEKLTIDGVYNYYLTTSSNLVDTLVLNIDGFSPKLYLFGFLIRSFMAIKENYFGEEMHFKTLEEYQELAYPHEDVATRTANNPHRNTNDLDVIVHVTVDSPCALLPENIYDVSSCIKLTAASLEADLRFTNYYMDLQFSLAPLKAALEPNRSADTQTISDTQVFIDGVTVYGHRLFGLPPAEPTYVCNWDFDVGRIIGECSTNFLGCLARALKSFDFSFDNEENALPLLNPLQLHDVTFLRAKIEAIHISILLDKAALLLSTGNVTTRFNDWANTEFSKRMTLSVPDLSVTAIDYNSLNQPGSSIQQTVAPIALLESTLNIRMVQQKADFDGTRKLQQEHVKLHDRRTQRTPWLIFDWEDIEPRSLQVSGEELSAPTIAIPTMPEPVTRYRSAGGGLSSLRRLSATGSNRSFRSFFVSSDISSTKSGRRQHSHSTTPLGFQFEERKDHNSSRSTVLARDIDLMHVGQNCSEAASTDYVDPSNPWSIPAFSFHKLKFDTSQLPLRPVSPGSSVQSDYADDKTGHPFSPGIDESTHTNLAIDLPQGIRGFCFPEFLHVAASLVERLQPSHPSAIIDSLQKDIVSDIVTYEKSMKSPRKCTSIAIRAPCLLVNLINPNTAVTDDFSFQDEYNLVVSHLKTEIRTKVERRKGDLVTGVNQTLTVHVAADGLSVSVQGSRVDAHQEKAELACMLSDMNFWLVTGTVQRSNFQVRSFETVTSTKSVEHLASLVRRTTTMVDSIASSFKHSISLSERRLRYLVYFLTQQAADVPDPSFLIRISNVLRVARTHLRQHDSWKIISRLRNVYKHLPSEQACTLIRKCLHGDFELPSNAKDLVLSSFDQWRAWDLAHVEKSYVMRSVWNSFEPDTPTATAAMLFSSTVKLFRISIDPGPRESDFVIEDMATAVSLDAPRDSLPAGRDDRRELIIVQSYCSSSSLRLRWEILDLVEGVLKTMSTVTLESAPPAPKPEHSPNPIELQLVLGADLGSVTLDGINVKLALAGKALRSSLVHKSRSSESAETTSLLLSSSACYSEFSSNSKVLMMWKLTDPHIYGSRVSEETGSVVTNEWMVAASCRKLRYDMKEDPLSLAHIADRLIEDEVRFIYELVNSVEFPTHQQGPSDSMGLVRNKFHVAVFLDDYRLSFCILPSLTYIISGEVARTSIMPKQGSKMEIDFDLKRNLHTFQSNEGGQWHSLSVIEIPPINGRIIADLAPGRTEMEVDVTIEVIQLEASAVRSLLGALTRPEFSHLMSDLKQNVEILQLHLNHVLALRKSPPERKDSSNEHIILYKARMTMAGTKIHATAPALNGNHYSADLDIRLGMVRLRLDNGLEAGHPMEYPEFHVDSSNLSLDLKKKESSTSHSYCSFNVDARLQGTSMKRDNGELRRVFHLSSTKFNVDLFPESAALLVDLAAHLQERIKTLDLSHEVKRFKKLRRRGHTEAERKSLEIPRIEVDDTSASGELFNAVYSLDFHNIQLGWNMITMSSGVPDNKLADLVFSIKRIELSNKKTNAAKLRIEDMQLQMVPVHGNRRKRSLNSALLPELVFNVAYASAGKEVRLAFQAAGKSLDLRATSEFILPASIIRDSIASAVRTIREANNILVSKPSGDSVKLRPIFGNKRFRSVLVDVDFAGATVSLQGEYTDDHQTMLTASLKGNQLPHSTYGQYVHGDGIATATFKAPGVALKVLYEDNGCNDPALNAELKVDASTNVLYPSLVPLVKQVTTTIKEVMGDHPRARRPSNTVMLQPQKLMSETPLAPTDPGSILGRCKLNIGILICRQEFSLSCQPIARVAATTQFDSVYVTINTVQSDEQERFIALLVAFNSLQASVKHVYSNESTARFEVKSMVMSIMNSKHLGSSKGISAVLRVSPMNVVLNAKQVQDLLLFREIWFPSNDDINPGPALQSQSQDTQAYIVQRYQQVAAAPAFPWNTTIAIEKLEIQLDLGSTLGKAQFAINDLWLSTKKTSEWEQILCVSFNTVGIESKGRMSGLVELQTLKVHTSINWPHDQQGNGTPLIQASISFGQLDVKVSFDYQPFLIAHISRFAFFMYNVRPTADESNERLFSILHGDQVQVFCTSMTASQALALFQAWQRLAQDKQAAYEASLQDVERYLRRKTSVFSEKPEASSKEISKPPEEEAEEAPISLHTGVVVSLNVVTMGVFPRSFFDNHVFKLEARDAQARFDVSLDQGKIHSALGLTLGQLRVALSNVVRSGPMEAEEMLLVSEIGSRVTGSRGGTILKVPRLVARMETWQFPGSQQIEYIFQSTFEGKVDVGWNYSRISFIRDMWESHSRALASRLGKPLPPSAVRITGALNGEGGGDKSESQEKITAVVNVPQSKYSYVALETPVIETPQLRDMGEATPPLEWIGLQRDKLPNITHQIIIVTLLELAKEVEDAYAKILGSS